MELSTKYLQLIDEALGTQIRLLSARINKARDDEIRICQFEKVKADIETLLLQQ